MTTYYDPNVPQSRDDWLKLSPSDRMRVAKNYHDSARIKASKGHAYLHVLVENQIACGSRPVVQALDRLQKGGMGRHDAIHAVAAVFTAYYRGLPLTPSSEEQSSAQLRLNAELEALTERSSVKAEP